MSCKYAHMHNTHAPACTHIRTNNHVHVRTMAGLACAEMTFGYSRDDISKFLPMYLEKGILQYDPFQVSCGVPMCVCVQEDESNLEDYCDFP